MYQYYYSNNKWNETRQKLTNNIDKEVVVVKHKNCKICAEISGFRNTFNQIHFKPNKNSW